MKTHSSELELLTLWCLVCHLFYHCNHQSISPWCYWWHYEIHFQLIYLLLAPFSILEACSQHYLHFQALQQVSRHASFWMMISPLTCTHDLMKEKCLQLPLLALTNNGLWGRWELFLQALTVQRCQFKFNKNSEYSELSLIRTPLGPALSVHLR